LKGNRFLYFIGPGMPQKVSKLVQTICYGS